jgi:hypothetical protein
METDSTATSRATIQPYEIVSIKRTEAPEGTEGAGWHHYVIKQGGNTISGFRQGSLRVVTGAVEEIILQLNERQLGKRGRVNLIPAPKKRG